MQSKDVAAVEPLGPTEELQVGVIGMGLEGRAAILLFPLSSILR